MTDEPTIEPRLEDQDVAFAHLTRIIDNWCVREQLNGTVPVVAASKLLQVLVETLRVSMGLNAVRVALLMVFEKTNDHPMNFIERDRAKDLLTKLSNARRQVEGGSPDLFKS